jgi:uncharacterized RDD family membrane protein YckC
MAYGMPPQSDPTNVMGRRVVAYLIDSVLLAGIVVAILAATKDQVFTGAPAHACRELRASGISPRSCLQIGSRVYLWKGSGLFLGYGAGFVASVLDLVVLQAVVGASIGKLIMGLRVVDGQGQKAGVGSVILRWILLIFVDNLCFLIGLLTASLTHPHRRVGDMAASTYVVALANVGRPVVAPAFAGQYGAYGQPGPTGWAPPGAVPQGGAGGWGAPPPSPYGAPGAPQGQPGGWTAPPPQQPTWGAPPPTGPPGWGAQPPAEAAPPTWGAPPPPPETAPGWGATPPPAPASPTSPGWAEPTPPPPAPPATPPSDPGPLGWDSPAPSTSPPPPPPPAPAAEPPAPAPEPTPSTEGESWWNKALGDEEPEK